MALFGVKGLQEFDIKLIDTVDLEGGPGTEDASNNSASFTLPQALRAQGLLKEAEHVESQAAETVLTPDECQLLGYLDKGKRKRKEKAGSLQWAYMAIARLGGFMDSKRRAASPGCVGPSRCP